MRIIALLIVALLAGCATVSNITGLPDATICRHVVFERTGGLWHATLEDCKA